MEHQYMLVSLRPDGYTNTVYVSSVLAKILEPHAITVEREDPGLTVLTLSVQDMPYAYNEK